MSAVSIENQSPATSEIKQQHVNAAVDHVANQPDSSNFEEKQSSSETSDDQIPNESVTVSRKRKTRSRRKPRRKHVENYIKTGSLLSPIETSKYKHFFPLSSMGRLIDQRSSKQAKQYVDWLLVKLSEDCMEIMHETRSLRGKNKTRFLSQDVECALRRLDIPQFAFLENSDTSPQESSENGPIQMVPIEKAKKAKTAELQNSSN